MASESNIISLANGAGKDNGSFQANVDPRQYVALTHCGDLIRVNPGNPGKDTATPPGENDVSDGNPCPEPAWFDDDFATTAMRPDPDDGFCRFKAESWHHAGNVYTIRYNGSDALTRELVVNIDSTNGAGTTGIEITCFAAGTEIETVQGLVPVEQLAVGDFVLCGDGRARPIRWVSKRRVSKQEMKQNPAFRPVRISKDALADNVPNADLVVSPQHRILINDWRAELLFGEAEVLVAAVHLLNDTDIIRDHQTKSVTYYDFMFDKHQTVWSNGVQSESFFPVGNAIKGVDATARKELYDLFPQLADDPQLYGSTCLPDLKAHEAHAMMGM